MKKTTTATKQKTALRAIAGTKGRKVVPFTKELALRFIRRAYPGARVTIITEEYYQKDYRVLYTIRMEAPGKYMTGVSWDSLQGAFESLIKNTEYNIASMLSLSNGSGGLRHE
jgi:hypothetical protein